VKKFGKSVQTWQKYGHEFVASLLGRHSVVFLPELMHFWTFYFALQPMRSLSALTVTVTFNTVRCPCNGLVREVSP